MHERTGTARKLESPTIRRLAVTLIAATLLIAGGHVQAAELYGKVVGVSDGDTLTVLDQGRATHRIRLDGIDAPERGQPYSASAREHLAALVFGKPVIVVWSKRDRYGRIVGQVHLAAGTACTTAACAQSGDVGLALIQAGLAWHYKRYQNEQSAQDRTSYSRAEDAARSQRLGLWHDAHPVAPWDHRGNHRADAVRTRSAPAVN